MKYFFLIVLIVFSGCVSLKQQNTDIPKWYTNAPQNNNIFIYGVNSGFNLEDAKANALNDMASRLIVTVSSTLNKNIQTSSVNTKQTSYTKDISQDINLEVEKIKFTNAIVEKNKIINNQFFIIMKVNRQKLFDENIKAFTLLDNKIDKIYLSLKDKPILEQIYQLQNAYPKLIKAKKLAYVLYAINNEFKYITYVTKYDNMIDDISKLKNLIIVDVQEDENNLFQEDLIGLLNQNFYKVSTKNVNMHIKIKNTVRHSKYKGWFIAKITSAISVISDNKNIANKTLNIIGRSGSNKKNALDNARNNFKNKINKIGLNSILFN